MASLRDIRRRIASFQSTRKITMAMEMVAAAKLRRSQSRIEALRPFADGVMRMMVDLAAHTQEAVQHPLLQEREVRTAAIVAMTGDRGLAGAFNANIVRRTAEIECDQRARGIETRIVGVGKKGIGTLRFRGFRVDEMWQDITDRPEYSHAKTITTALIEKYIEGEVDEVRLVYNHFTSAIQQTLIDDVILPIPQETISAARRRKRAPTAYNYEPAAAEIFGVLLPAYVEIAVYRGLLESSASEQGARMTAMRNASDAAEEMLDTQTLALNRARQAAITQEILEVVGGAEGLG